MGERMTEHELEAKSCGQLEAAVRDPAHLQAIRLVQTKQAIMMSPSEIDAGDPVALFEVYSP